MITRNGKTLFAFLFSFFIFTNQPLAFSGKPLRIVHVVTYLKAAGGVEAQLYDLIRHLKQTGKFEHHVIYFAHDRIDMVDKIKSLGVPVHHVHGWLQSKTPVPGPVLYSRFKKLIKKLKPDIIHSGLWTADIMSRFVGKALKIPVVCDIHADCHQLPWLWNWSNTKTVHLASRIVAVSKVAQVGFEQCVLRKMNGKNQQRFKAHDLMVVSNGVDVDKVIHDGQTFPLSRQEIGLTDEDFVFGYVCHLSKNKGCDVLIDAFAKLCKHIAENQLRSEGTGVKKTPRLCIVGGGSLITKLQALAVSLGVADKVLFMGHRSDALRFYPLFDCYMMASHFEAISVALLDAMCFNLPIITTARGGVHDVVQHRINGLIVAPGDCGAMSNAMYDVFVHQEQARIMGNFNKALVEQNFSFKRKAELYEKIFDEVVLEYEKK